MRNVELLIPAGSLEVLRVAVDYGADAVYIGGESYGLRAKAHNFTIDEMKEAVDYCHGHEVKLYVTVNIFAHNADLAGIEDYFERLKPVGVDALIISDPAVFMLARKVLPEVDIHISTQANNTNYGIYQFWHDLGAVRVVSARELSLKEIREIRDKIPEDMEIESFIHGAMCISYSGRCLLSHFLTGRDANQGECTHPCRWKYSVVEEKRPGEYF
ncbi:MAG: U32 family peptidase, partial [Lachnospiraceae bacterium]|nr:U32 family peptidase [Lachnospiraceae bacterium]